MYNRKTRIVAPLSTTLGEEKMRDVTSCSGENYRFPRRFSKSRGRCFRCRRISRFVSSRVEPRCALSRVRRDYICLARRMTNHFSFFFFSPNVPGRINDALLSERTDCSLSLLRNFQRQYCYHSAADII